MTAVLHRLGYVYRKPKLVPCKADPTAQKAFLAAYEKLKQQKGDDPLYFADAVYPQHNPVLACGSIIRGEDREVRTSTGRRRVNINGAVDLKRLEPVVRFDDTIDAASTIALFAQLEELNLLSTWIYPECFINLTRRRKEREGNSIFRSNGDAERHSGCIGQAI